MKLVSIPSFLPNLYKPSSYSFFDKMIFRKEMRDIKMSPIVRISEEAAKIAPDFERAGRPFIYFQRGEVDFPTPRFVIDALVGAVEQGKTKYPKSGGELKFKEAIINKLYRENGVKGLSSENIIATYGGQEALELSFKLFNKGAGFSPCWSCVLENFVPYSGIDFKQIPLNEDFSVDYKKIDESMKEADFFYLNNPHNPTGKVFSEEEVSTIADICQARKKFMISDEAYENIVFDGKRHFSAASLNLEDIISCFTFSKTYSMTGWRLGYAVTKNKEAAEILKKGEYTQTAGVTTFMQYAGADALDNHEESRKWIGYISSEFQKRRDVLYDNLSKIEGLEINRPGGAFYMFPKFTRFIPKDLSGQERDKYSSLRDL